MPTSSSVSKHFSSSSDLASALSACNAVFERDFGPGHVLDADCAPEILLMAKDESGTVNGVVGLHFHEESCAWELGTVSASVPRSHSPLMGFLLEKEAPVAIRHWYGEVCIFERFLFYIRSLLNLPGRRVACQAAQAEEHASADFDEVDWLRAACALYGRRA